MSRGLVKNFLSTLPTPGKLLYLERMDLDVSEFLPLLGLSHAEIAVRTGTTRGYVQQVSAGNRKVGRKHAAAFARLFRERAESNAAALRAAADALDPPPVQEPEKDDDGTDTNPS